MLLNIFNLWLTCMLAAYLKWHKVKPIFSLRHLCRVKHFRVHQSGPPCRSLKVASSLSYLNTFLYLLSLNAHFNKTAMCKTFRLTSKIGKSWFLKNCIVACKHSSIYLSAISRKHNNKQLLCSPLITCLCTICTLEMLSVYWQTSAWYCSLSLSQFPPLCCIHPWFNHICDFVMNKAS